MPKVQHDNHASHLSSSYMFKIRYDNEPNFKTQSCNTVLQDIDRIRLLTGVGFISFKTQALSPPKKKKDAMIFL